MKSAGFHEIRMKSAGFHEIRMKSGGFHEIHPKPCKIRRVFAETSDFMVKSAGFHGEIRWISWNPLDFMDFMKSTRFHGEIRRISWWNPLDFTDFTWNPPDFMNVSFCVMIKYRSFYRKTKHSENTTTRRVLTNFMHVSQIIVTSGKWK